MPPTQKNNPLPVWYYTQDGGYKIVLRAKLHQKSAVRDGMKKCFAFVHMQVIFLLSSGFSGIHQYAHVSYCLIFVNDL